MASGLNSLLAPQAEDTSVASVVDYEVVESQERLGEVVGLLLQERLVGVDTENTAIDPYLGNPLILQIGTSDKCYAFPAFIGLDFEPLKQILENRDILKVLFNAKYDFQWILFKYGISIENLFCVQAAERLITVGKPGAPKRPSLAFVAEKYLGIKMDKDIRRNFIDRDPIAKPITKEEYTYSCTDVAILPDLFFQTSILLEQAGLGHVSQLENDVIAVAAEMELYGSLIDRDKWEELIRQASGRLRGLSQKLHEMFSPVVAQTNLFGLPAFNLNSTEQLMTHINKLLVKEKVRTDGGALIQLENTDEQTLNRYKRYHPIFAVILDYRGYQKIVQAYGQKFLDTIHRITGRIHARFNQLEADSGRMSSSKPNLQQVLGFNEEDPESLNFRSCFMARPGYKLVGADYSQQELRILADFSGDPALAKAYLTQDENGKDIDVHTYTASLVFDTPYTQVNKGQRRIAKTLNFMLVYGGGAQKLSETLEITQEEAQQTIDDYFKRYPGIKKVLDRWANETIKIGYSKTVSQRRRYMQLPAADHPEFNKFRSSIKRKAMNNPIQGSAADVTKLALVYVRRGILMNNFDARILMVVHDEIVVEAREDQAEAVARMVEREMIAAFAYYFKKIPMRVDAHVSDCWAK